MVRLLAAALALSACGQAGGAGSRPLSPGRAVLTGTTGGSAGPPDSKRPAIARRAAERILEGVTLPAGSKTRAHPPSRFLRQAPSVPGDPDLVDLHRFAVVDRSAHRLLAFLRAHPAPGATSSGSGEAGGRRGTYEWELSFSFPPVATVLDSRTLVESVVSLGAERSALRLDAQVTWLPAKPAADRIPADAKLLTAWLSKGLNPWQHGHRPVTTSDSSLVSRIRQDVNDLGVQAPGVYACPADFGQVLHLVFRPKAGAAPLAVVLVDPAGCEGVTVVRDGRAVKPSLDGFGFAARLEKALGWRVR